ncbi:hypothetical protein OG285_32650 [Streptomyces sp. NBC_01471]|uniref:hypothetical protein n=1 Tax=Streptomyces sp. NBC_01471 TaxID=2903879 RepID=UPI00324F1F47
MPRLSAAETNVIGEKVKTFELTREMQGRLCFPGGTMALERAWQNEGKKACEIEVVTAQDRFRNVEEACEWGADRAFDPRTGRQIEL